MKKLFRRLKMLISSILFIIILIVFCIWQNNSIVISNFNYYSSEVPSEFKGFKIVQISDLHNKMFGKEQLKLLEKIEKLSPDIIVVTGDLIDRRRYNLDEAMHFIEGSLKVAPIYYVSGNHEAWSGKYNEISEKLIEAGVHILDNTTLELFKGKSKIQLLGLSDPAFLTSSYLEDTNTSNMEKYLSQWEDMEEFKILLSHRPEIFDLYCEYNINMIFSGHAHGGQFRIPSIGGLFAPDQGFFPKYTSGNYTNDKSTMFVSRGLGNSVLPIRLFNRPEIISVTLKSSDEKL